MTTTSYFVGVDSETEVEATNDNDDEGCRRDFFAKHETLGIASSGRQQHQSVDQRD